MGTKVAKGSLSGNKDRATDKHPDYKGSITTTQDIPAGTKLWLAGWARENERGRYVSLSLEISDASPAKPAARPAVKDELSDEIPF